MTSTVRAFPVTKDALNNVGEAVRTRQKSAKKRSLLVVNEYFELVFNNVLTTQAIIQRFLKSTIPVLFVSLWWHKQDNPGAGTIVSAP